LKQVLGMGSPHGADRAGWLLAERLLERTDLGATVRPLSTPLELLDHLDGCEFLLVVDACRTGADEGTVLRLSWPDSRIRAHQSLSSHGLGLGESLLLAEQLGKLPENVVLLCLEVADQTGAPTGSEEPIPGMDELERRVLEELVNPRFEKLDSPE